VTFVGFSPARKVGVVMMFNCDYFRGLKKIADAALGTPARPKKES
jgi:hypothetical protein